MQNNVGRAFKKRSKDLMKMKEAKNIINDNFKLEQFRKIDNLTLRGVLQRGAVSTIFKVFGMSRPRVD